MTLFTRSSLTRSSLKFACILPLSLLFLMSVAIPGHAQQKITIGTGTSGNYIPLGVSQNSPDVDYSLNTDFQQIYSATNFSGAVYLDSIAFASSSVFDPTAATYDVTIGLSNTSIGVNDTPLLSLAQDVPDFFSANRGANYTTVFSGSVTADLAANNTFDLVFPITPFLFDPSQGNLLVDIVLTSPIETQGNVGFLSDDTGDMRRAYQTSDPFSGDVYDHANNIGALVTQFQATPAAVPEASTTVSFGLLLTMGIGGGVIAAKKKKASA